MKNLQKAILLAFLILVTASCSSSRSKQKAIPIIKGETVYSLEHVSVKLNTFGIKLTKSSEVKGYLSEQEMTDLFNEKIISHLMDNNLLDKGEEKEYSLSIQINYTRNFAVNSNKVLSPDFSYSIRVYSGNTIVTQYQSGTKEKRGIMLLGEWFRTGSSDINPEAELKYINEIAEYIVKGYIAELGR